MKKFSVIILGLIFFAAVGCKSQKQTSGKSKSDTNQPAKLDTGK